VPVLQFCNSVLIARVTAMQSEGIFRLSGEQAVVNQIRNMFDNAVDDSISLDDFDVHDVASALKLFLRQMPEPLLTRRLFQPLVELSSMCRSWHYVVLRYCVCVCVPSCVDRQVVGLLESNPEDDEAFVRKLRLELSSLHPTHIALLQALCPLLRDITRNSHVCA
jgi:hypothetical protein